jgi:Avidin family
MKRLVTALAFVIATSVSAFAESFPLPSGWQNQRGSDMDLYPASNGNFNYFNHAPGFQCQNGPMNPVRYKITGHASGDSVIFSVVWNNGIVNCNSQTVSTGTLQGRTLTTRWTLTGPGINPIRGTDIFQQRW